MRKTILLMTHRHIGRLFGTLLMLSLAATGLQAQTTWNLDDIVDGRFGARGIYGLRPAADGHTYTQLSQGGRLVERNSFRTGERTAVLFDASEAKGPATLSRIDGYVLSADERLMLLQTNTQRIYRRSFTADYYVYDVQTKEFFALTAEGGEQAPTFSPDGTKVAFARHNDLYLVDLAGDRQPRRLTDDGCPGKIINGIPDWVYEEEFSTNQSFCFSADGNALCWIRYDESRVPLYHIAMYKGARPTIEANDTYPGSMDYKYPVPGQVNSAVTVKAYNLPTGATCQLQVPVDTDGYIPRLMATPDPSKMAIVTLNRHQNLMKIYTANPADGTVALMLTESEPEYIKEEAYANLAFFDDCFVMQSERTRHSQLYLYRLDGTLIRPLTSGQEEVTAFYGYDRKTDKCYYAATDGGPLRRAVYVADRRGARKLTAEPGTHSALFSRNYRYFVHTYSNAATAPVVSLCDAAGRVLKPLVDNAELSRRVAEEGGTKEFFTFTTTEGVQLNGWMVKPADFDPAQKYPIILYQYSGPGSQEVADAWSLGFYGGGVFESYMAQQGYLVACVDGRGTGYRGTDFEKCTYLNLGDKESKDQVEAAIYLGSLPYVDNSRIGIWGWSYGGFNTLMSMSEGRPVFKCGVAVAAPTNWKYYDTVYTERYMRTPQENKGYDLNPISRAAQLSGSLLLVHGLADDNVHFRNCAEYSEALVQAGKQFEMQVYTNRNHFITGGNTRRHLFKRITDYFRENL